MQSFKFLFLRNGFCCGVSYSRRVQEQKEESEVRGSHTSMGAEETQLPHEFVSKIRDGHPSICSFF
jgi:hypothetical protein